MWPTFRERFRRNPVRMVFWTAVYLYVVLIIVTLIWGMFFDRQVWNPHGPY